MTCDKCKHISRSYDGKPFAPPGGSCHDKVYMCSCGQGWWQYNDYYHLWRAVPDVTYDAVRLGDDVAIDVNTGEVIGRGCDFI